jgi:hypothetical protein
MVSVSDLQTPAGWTKVQVIWDLSVNALGGEPCQYTNLVIRYPTSSFLGELDAAGQPFEQSAAGLQEAVADPNRRGTPAVCGQQHPAQSAHDSKKLNVCGCAAEAVVGGQQVGNEEAFTSSRK